MADDVCRRPGGALYRSATQARDFLQRALERGNRDSPASVGLVHKEAGNSPVWKESETVAVGPLALDARQFFRRAELAPTDAGSAVIDKGRMSASLTRTAFLFGSVLRGCLATPDTLGMKCHPPAATPHTVVPLDQRSKVWPRGLAQGLDGKAGHDRTDD